MAMLFLADSIKISSPKWKEPTVADNPPDAQAKTLGATDGFVPPLFAS